jgi:putative tricarboxylic transport membrane protein
MLTDRVIFICTLIVASIYLYATTQISVLEIGDPLGPKAFPRLLGIGLLLAAGMLGLEIWRDRKKVALQPEAPAPFDFRVIAVLAGVVLWTGGYYLVFDKLGFVVATSIYLLPLMVWFNHGKWIINILSAVVFSGLTYLLFVKLDVNLPKGILPF